MMPASITIWPPNGLQFSKSGKAFIGISLNNFVSRSPLLLRELFSWTASRFAAFDVLLGDFLTRHNYEAFSNLQASAAIEKAMQDGKRTSERIAAPMAEASPGAQILSARTLYQEPGFRMRLSRFERQYEQNPTFRRLIDQAVNEFLNRRRVNHASTTIRHHCVAYQLEELVLFELLAEAGYTSLVYAGAHLPVMQGIVSKQLSGVSNALQNLALVEMRFHKQP